jgi:aspartyl-tRNA(Asn)/glutamyl-tRNA(Gln) amidotransferase subunit C
MALTPEQVRHIGRLARLGLTEDDVDKFSHQLSDILDYFQKLGAIDTNDVPPTAYPLDLHNIMRDDEPQPAADREDVLMNAPVREGDYLRVRAILDE